MTPPWVETERPLELYRNGDPIEHPANQATLTDTDEAVRFIRDNKAGPFFLYLAHTMPHVPLFASSRFAGRSELLHGKGALHCRLHVGRHFHRIKPMHLPGAFVLKGSH